MTEYISAHRKAIAGAVLGAATAVIASMASGATWQVAVVAGVAAALGVGVPVGAVRNGPKKA